MHVTCPQVYAVGNCNWNEKSEKLENASWSIKYITLLEKLLMFKLCIIRYLFKHTL